MLGELSRAPCHHLEKASAITAASGGEAQHLGHTDLPAELPDQGADALAVSVFRLEVFGLVTIAPTAEASASCSIAVTMA